MPPECPPVPSSQAGGTGGTWSPALSILHPGDHVVTHIAAVVDYAARWPRGPWGTRGSWGTLWRERRCVRVPQSRQSPWGDHVQPPRGKRSLREGGMCPSPKGIGSPGSPSVCVPPSAGLAARGGHGSAHPQAQDTTDIGGVTLLALQPVHAGTSLWMSSRDEPRPCPPTSSRVTPWQHPWHHPTPRHHTDTMRFGVRWVRDVRTGWGDAAEEAMAEGTNKPGAGLTGLPGKPISPFIPALPWGPWRGEKMRMGVAQSRGTPRPPLPPISPVPLHGLRGGLRW